MRHIKLIAGSIAALWMSGPIWGETLSVSHPSATSQKLLADGVHLTPTGPEDLPVVLGGMEILGATAPFLNNSVTSRYYSATATLTQPATRITLDVARMNNSGWDNPITLTAWDKGKRIASTTMNIAPLGEKTQISVTAPAIDKFTWGGDGWVYHPYEVKGLLLDVSPAKSVSSTPPVSVSAADDVSAVPEPLMYPLLTALGTIVILSRRRAMRPGLR